MVPGECVLERVELVEDTKANSGEPGCLIMTNLRLLWYSHKTAKLNLSKDFLMLAYLSCGLNGHFCSSQQFYPSQPLDTIPLLVLLLSRPTM